MPMLRLSLSDDGTDCKHIRTKKHNSKPDTSLKPGNYVCLTQTHSSPHFQHIYNNPHELRIPSTQHTISDDELNK